MGLTVTNGLAVTGDTFTNTMTFGKSPKSAPLTKNGDLSVKVVLKLTLETVYDTYSTCLRINVRTVMIMKMLHSFIFVRKYSKHYVPFLLYLILTTHYTIWIVALVSTEKKTF